MNPNTTDYERSVELLHTTFDKLKNKAEIIIRAYKSFEMTHQYKSIPVTSLKIEPVADLISRVLLLDNELRNYNDVLKRFYKIIVTEPKKNDSQLVHVIETLIVHLHTFLDEFLDFKLELVVHGL